MITPNNSVMSCLGLKSHTKMLFQFILTIYFLWGSIAVHYTFFNGTSQFTEYRIKFKKTYDTAKSEQAAFINFLENLNRVSVLNENSTDNITIYVLNKYADLDPTEVHERYAINLKPYDAVKRGDKAEVLRSNQGIEIRSSNFFDLDDADDLYKKFKAKYNKNYTKAAERTAHYYRFVKTLVQKNNDIFEGKDIAELDDKADIIEHKDDFFY